jgi:tetratricopeptide (TPR) repeat protein
MDRNRDAGGYDRRVSVSSENRYRSTNHSQDEIDSGRGRATENRPGVVRVRINIKVLSGVLLSLVLPLTVFFAATNDSRPAPSEQLGHVDFPNSCKAEAQPALLKGVALLHSFQYMASESAFKAATDLDGNCAIAHWGAAMALYHQLWDFPGRRTLKEGLENVEEAQKLSAPTPREQGYIAAAAAFYRDDANLSHVQRTTAYSQALAQLHSGAPGDVEASAFYALSLVALADEDVDDTANRKKAIAILEPLFQQHPDNPGVAHYLIHATDKPQFASEGLAAARAYAKIAPDSSHALHMPSHIFTRLGLWQESIASNIAATAAAAHSSEMHQSESHYQTHAMDFLDYAYLQSGQEAKARALSAEEMNVPGSGEREKADHRAVVDARNALELHRWKEAADLTVPERRNSQDATYWARAIGAARSGDVASAKTDVEKLTEVVAHREGESKTTGYDVSAEKATDLREAEAWLAYAQGDSPKAIELLRAAADREDGKGVDSVTMPAREMLGDLLMELKKPSDAMQAYKTVLLEAPNRFDALLGAAQGSLAAGDTHSARDYYSQLLKVADPAADRPELKEARTYLGAGLRVR